MQRKAVSVLLMVLLVASVFCVASSVTITPVKAQTQRGPQMDTLRLKVTTGGGQKYEMLFGPPAGSDCWRMVRSVSDLWELQSHGMTISARPGLNYYRIVINYRTYPLCDVNFRHALAHLVPKDRIIQTMFQSQLVIKVDSPVPPAQAQWYNPSVDAHPYSTAEAEQILRDAGYDNPGGVWTGPSPIETLRFFAPQHFRNPTEWSVCNMIVNEFQDFGLDVQLIEQEYWDTCSAVFDAWNFDLAWVYHNLGESPTHLWHQFSSLNNYPGSQNPHGMFFDDLDTVLETFWGSLIPDARVQAAKTAQELIMGGSTTSPLPHSVTPSYGSLPTIPVYSAICVGAQNPGLRGAISRMGYDIDNSWSYLNMYWNTPDNYRPGTSERMITVIVDGWPLGLNPLHLLTEYERDFIRHSFDGLMVANPYSLKEEPWLATSWSYTTTPSGMDITFNLRLNDLDGQPITWQDGTPISAADVQFAWDFLRDWEIPTYWDVFQFYSSSEIVDADTIIAHMTTIGMWQTGIWQISKLAETAFLLPPQVWNVDPRDDQPWSDIYDIMGFDPTALPYPDPDGEGPRIALPTHLFGTGPFVLQNSRAFISGYGYADLDANRDYWMTTSQIEAKISDMFHHSGDVNYDGVVDTTDLAAIGLAYGTSPGDPLWNPAADICGPAGSPPDNLVDIFDMATVGKFYGETRTVQP